MFLKLDYTLPEELRTALVTACYDDRCVSHWHTFNQQWENIQSGKEKAHLVNSGRRHLPLYKHHVYQYVLSFVRELYDYYDLDDKLFVPIENNYTGSCHLLHVAYDAKLQGRKPFGVHRHIDDEIDNKIHFRMNFVVQNPLQGGEYEIDKRVVSFEENDGWGLFASKDWHAQYPVVGEKDSILLSLGFNVDRDYAKTLHETLDTY